MQRNIARIGRAVLLATLVSNAALAGEEIIVDNKEAQFKGSWTKSTGSTQKYKEDYRFFSSTDAKEPTATAEFRPVIPAAGRYDVDIWFTSGDNRSTMAPVVISCRSGTQTFKVDEKRDGGKWVNVAKNQEFDLGNSGFIILGNNTGATGTVVVADAIRLTQVGGEPGFVVNFSPAVGGTFIKDPNKSGFVAGSSVQITAIADEGYVFNGWTGDVTGMANPMTLTMDRDKNIGATFIQGGIGVIMEYDEAVYFGDWTQGDVKFGKPHGDGFRWISGGKGKANKATATFTPDLPRKGNYDIYVWFTPGGNRSEGSPFEITSKSGKQVVRINQKTGGNDWVLLAAGQEFDAGKSGSVRLMNDVPEPSAVVVSDAVAFVYVGGQMAKK